MKIKKVQSTEPVVAFVAEKLQAHLRAGERVLWLTAGGSCIAVAATIAERLQNEDLSLLTVGLTDERYGVEGHADSNWKQLQDVHFSLSGATLQPVLTNESRQDSTDKYNAFLAQALEGSDYSFGLFGMGSDGHMAGLFPGSDALVSTNFAADFQGADFERITMTPLAIERLDGAVLFAMGEPKREALNNLEKELQLESQPAQVLKHVPDFIVFSDLKGE